MTARRSSAGPAAGYASTVRRLLSPTYGARTNAAEALSEMVDDDAGVVLHGSDLALFSGHPSGLSARRAAGRLGTALWEVFPGHVALLDRDGVIVSVNRAWREFGLENGGSSTAGLGANYLEVCERAVGTEPEAAEAASMVRAALRGDCPPGQLEYPCGGDGDQRWFGLQVFPLPGRHSGALVLHVDVTPYVHRERLWQHRATHDPLTGLPNRVLLLDRLTHALDVAERDPRSLAVLFIDLDSFKSVNDRLGHEAGDEVLCQAAARMAQSVRAADTIGRWGGDEFLVIADRLDGAASAQELAERIRESLRAPFAVCGSSSVQVAASVGIAYPDRHARPDDLVIAADRALRDVRQASGRAFVRA